MNKRIAKKIRAHSERYPWRIHEAAQGYLDRRRGTPYKRTLRIVREIGRGPHDAEQIERLVTLWDEHRPYIWHAIRGMQWFSRKLVDPIKHGHTLGLRDIDGSAEPLSELIIKDLCYYSDRWCVWRFGRIDVMIEHLRQERAWHV